MIKDLEQLDRDFSQLKNLISLSDIDSDDLEKKYFLYKAHFKTFLEKTFNVTSEESEFLYNVSGNIEILRFITKFREDIFMKSSLIDRDDRVFEKIDEHYKKSIMNEYLRQYGELQSLANLVYCLNETRAELEDKTKTMLENCVFQKENPENS